MQRAGDVGNFCVMPGFGFMSGKIRVAIGIEQT